MSYWWELIEWEAAEDSVPVPASLHICGEVGWGEDYIGGTGFQQRQEQPWEDSLDNEESLRCDWAREQ